MNCNREMIIMMIVIISGIITRQSLGVETADINCDLWLIFREAGSLIIEQEFCGMTWCREYLLSIELLISGFLLQKFNQLQFMFGTKLFAVFLIASTLWKTTSIAVKRHSAHSLESSTSQLWGNTPEVTVLYSSTVMLCYFSDRS